MATGQPISEQIIDNIETTVLAITEAAGFNQDVKEFSRVTKVAQVALDQFPSIDVQSIRIIKTNEPPAMISWTDCELRMVMGCYVNIRTPAKIKEGLNKLTADIEKAIMTDHTRGSLAQNTEVSDIDPTLADDRRGKFTGHADIEIFVKFRHKRGNPFSN